MGSPVVSDDLRAKFVKIAIPTTELAEQEGRRVWELRLLAKGRVIHLL
jgi:hypothetical protein